jgi:outer membrane protein OmpA-like peptidoglycan-associated protein
MRNAAKRRLVGALALAAALAGVPALAQAEDLLPLDADKSQIEHAFGADSDEGFAPLSHGGPSHGTPPGHGIPGAASPGKPVGEAPSKPEPAGQRPIAGPAARFAPQAFDLPPGIYPHRIGAGELAPVPVAAPARVVGVPGIQFDYGSAHLTDASQYIVDEIGTALARRNWFVTVVGHTDASGDPRYNVDLSQRRALTVAFYLVNVRGLSPDRIAYTGVGAAQPIDPNDPFAPANRRVTFVLQE